MKIVKGNIEGIFVIEFNPHIDERGFFMRVFDEKILSDFGINKNWVQENHSRTIKKGTIRGMHFQLPPFSETKFVRCVKGKIQDAFVDLRKNSNTFGKWGSVIISEENFKCLIIPKGFAHGFCTLTDNCEVLYKVDNFYSPEHERGLIWNDSDIGIKWEVENPILSEKDKNNMTLKEFINKNGSIEL